MKTYDELKGEDKKTEKEFLKNLREMCKKVNESELLEKNIVHVGKNGPTIFDNFITAIETLIEAGTAQDLPEDVIDFYEYTILDMESEDTEEYTPEDPKELDFGDDNLPEPEPEPDEGEEHLVEESYEPEPEEGETEETEEESQEEPESEEEEPDLTFEPTNEEPLPKMKKLSKSPMSVKIEDKILTVKFKQLKTEKKFNLPEPGDKEALRAVRKAAFAFASENDATRGQKQHISKELNEAGYYMR